MKTPKIISIAALLIIITFVNFNDESSYVWWLVYYIHQYLISGAFIYLGFIIDKSLLTRSALFTLGFYFVFEFSMDILRIFDSELWELIYQKRTINYVLSLGCSLSLLLLPLHNIYRKWNT